MAAEQNAANRRERLYAAHPFGMPVRFARRWLEDRGAPVGSKRPAAEPVASPANGWASDTGNESGNGGTANCRVVVTLSGTWNAVPGQFYDDGAWMIEGAECPHAEATDAELAEAMRLAGPKSQVLREWELLDLIEVYVGAERVW